MEATRRLEIELPEELADAVRARVASGEFGSESEVVATGLKLLDDRDVDANDSDLETWLRSEVVPAYQEWKAGGEKGLTADEVQASLAKRRTERQRPDAAE